MTQTSEAKLAKLRFLGYLRNRGEGVAGGVVLWSEEDCSIWKADAEEISQDLTFLGVPHYVTRTRVMQSPWRSSKTKIRPCRWEKIWIRGDDFKVLTDVIPSLTKIAVLPVANESDTQLMVTQGHAFVVVNGEELLWTVSSDGQKGEYPTTRRD